MLPPARIPETQWHVLLEEFAVKVDRYFEWKDLRKGFRNDWLEVSVASRQSRI